MSGYYGAPPQQGGYQQGGYGGPPRTLFTPRNETGLWIDKIAAQQGYGQPPPGQQQHYGGPPRTCDRHQPLSVD
jgi:hypothetical protein